MADDTTTTPAARPAATAKKATAKKATAKRAPAKKAATASRNTHVVMIGNSHDTANGDVVKVSAADAERLISNGHARQPYPGEIKAAKGE